MRKDLEIIADLIPSSSKVLEIGCCDGELLSFLVANKNVDGRGIEISQKGVSECVRNGLSVIQGDADKDLQYYPDHSFKYVISSQVLQATKEPKLVLQEMFRIAEYVVISIPNFGFWKNRLYLLLKGKMPVTKSLSYEWYDTPNIHFCTVKDFIKLCSEITCKVDKAIYLKSQDKKLPTILKSISVNWFAEKAIFVLKKNS